MALTQPSTERLIEILKGTDKNHLVSHVVAELDRVRDLIPLEIRHEIAILEELKRELEDDLASPAPLSEGNAAEAVVSDLAATAGEGTPATEPATETESQDAETPPAAEPAATPAPAPADADAFWAADDNAAA